MYSVVAYFFCLTFLCDTLSFRNTIKSCFKLRDVKFESLQSLIIASVFGAYSVLTLPLICRADDISNTVDGSVISLNQDIPKITEVCWLDTRIAQSVDSSRIEISLFGNSSYLY
jgi:hypothetical protein